MEGIQAFLSKMSHVGWAMKLNSKVKMKWKSGANVEGSDTHTHTRHTVQHSYGVSLPHACPSSPLLSFKPLTFLSSLLLLCVDPATQSVKHPSFRHPSGFPSTCRSAACSFLSVEWRRKVSSDLISGASLGISAPPLCPSWLIALPDFLVFGNWQIKLPVLTL